MRSPVCLPVKHPCGGDRERQRGRDEPGQRAGEQRPPQHQLHRHCHDRHVQ
jgi:hypothetical protein